MHTGGNSVIPDHTLQKAAIEQYLSGGLTLEAITYQVVLCPCLSPVRPGCCRFKRVSVGCGSWPTLADTLVCVLCADCPPVSHTCTQVENGKGAMPAKGGNAALEQADVENAVRYMLEQAGASAPGS